MSDAQHISHGTQPPTSPKGHPLPRRSSPEQSITLRNHRLAQEASTRAASMRVAPAISSGSSSPRRQSSGESYNTGPSDPKKWFDQNNENPTASYSHGMDVDTPFFQKMSESSNEDIQQHTSYPTHLAPPMPGNFKPSATHSSSADDYRSVIDDLTIEIKRLKDELKRYKQKGPEMMKRDKLFEIKVHGLPKRKKRELESTLRDFASGLENKSPSAETSSARQKSRHMARLESGSGSASKHASSSSGSHSRPVDSAYASMSIGANSSGTSLVRPSISSRAKSSDQKVENYLKDIPEGLYPRHMVLTEKDKQKLIVRRLEQIFTGRIGGRNLTQAQPKSSANIASYAPIMVEPATGHTTTNHAPSNVPMGFHEPSREARILTSEGNKELAKDYGSASRSNDDQPDSGGNSAVNDTSPLDPTIPDQRPTRPLDLDPDRKQNPSANMDYIRHLGLAPPHLTGLATYEDVSPDADGWVYLNLLCNMAQLHMLNVAPDYIRSAVSERSTKFQLSPDGRKIRWRGGTEGTKFSSDSSGDTSQTSPSEGSDLDPETGHTNKRKRRHVSKSGLSSAGQNLSDQMGSGLKVSSVDSFHYQPLFAHHSSSGEQTSQDDTSSSFGVGEDSNKGESRWGNSGSGSARRKRRRLDGAIIYYSGAPFCMDLSGDPGDMSPSYLNSTVQDEQTSSADSSRPGPHRTESGSALPLRPLTDGEKAPSVAVVKEAGSLDSEMNIEADFPWSNDSQDVASSKLDACGLGGVIPDDHFMVVAITKRPKNDALPPVSSKIDLKNVTRIVNRITSPLGSWSQAEFCNTEAGRRSPISIQYTSKAIRKLNPTPLPPPGMYFSFDSDTSETSDEYDSEFDALPRAVVESRACPTTFENQYPDNVEMSSCDEEDVEPDDGDEPLGRLSEESSEESSKDVTIPILPRAIQRASSSSAVAAAGTVRGRSKSLSAELPAASGSSVATAGGAESGYSSGCEESG
ncbi:Frequency clock protein [Colletotrichum tanaceti]|uniref:Frequency clock protein n=1 Tax=Colletotrichum tanaceti TaxID=1306861 RepID=A0A4U6XSP3_9PEZI|nr:Frequency clock protein [Colletotrichum tanaceti]KAJ0167784.1 Frequency clock protein [Colletotrichum tanaceti]TKW58955.1 Frequency clock protein [Colletotrichum tanaceti]